ncbi:regulator, BldB [Streptomyces cinnamoneus]|uniref:Regulator, BldB n=2 Tax=Streptomyces TaxID=1883 RepID=A0A918U1Y9_STRCJ|nr:regulator, BldB [Streptomyces cinnamoneus]
MATEEEKEALYAMDISGAEWHSAPGDTSAERVEIAYLEGGAVGMRSSADPDTVLRYTKSEWDAFVLGVRDGEFDIEVEEA